MSTERSSSAVRNLRSIFENKESEREASENRAHSGSRAASREGRSRPLSKVRSSFVAVERPSMASTAEQTDGGELERVSSASLRRQSFSENDENRESLEAFKKTVSQDSERRGRESSVQETIPEVAVESTVNTPGLEIKENQALGITPKPSKLNAVSTVEEATPTAASTDKTSANADTESVSKSAEPVPSATTSDEKAETNVNADSSREVPTSKPLATQSNGPKTTSSRPSNILPKKAPKQSVESPKSPASVKSATSSLAQSTKAAVKDLSRKISRSSLTAPTAASNARAGGAEKSDATTTRASLPAKREPTKAANISAHLLAPTAASRARREQDAQAKSSTDDSRTKTNLKSSQVRSTPRQSLASQPRPESSSSQATKKVAAPDSGFLERMTRPTAASRSRVQEKVVESKPAARRSVPVHKKAISSTNGHSSAPDNTTPSELVDVTEEASAESDTTDLATATLSKEVETAPEVTKDDAVTTTV